MHVLFAAVALLGCTSSSQVLKHGGESETAAEEQAEPQTSENCSGTFSGEAEDLTIDIEAAPEGGLSIRLPCIEVPSYISRFYCYFDTYEGPTMGIDYLALFYSEHSHHSTMMVVEHGDDEHEDGILYDCSDWLQDGSYAPMIADSGTFEDHNVVAMPDGFAFKLESGTRYVLEVHYINPLEEPIAVNDGANIGLLPEDEVTTWVSSFHFDAKVDIPSGTEHTECVTCTVPEDYGVLSMQGHMHDRGHAFQVDLTRDGVTETLYELPAWDPAWTDNPFDIIEGFEAGELGWEEGDEITTCCTWINDTESTIIFPQEMCSFLGVVYPLSDPWVCAGESGE